MQPFTNIKFYIVMRKLLFCAVAVAALSFTACGGQKGANSAEADSLAQDSIELAEAVEAVESEFNQAIESADTAQIVSALDAIKAKISEFAANGKEELAAKFRDQIAEFVNTKSEAISKIAAGSATLSEAVNSVASIPTSSEELAKMAVDSAKTAVKDAANEVVNDAKDAVNEKVNEGKEKLENAKDAAKQKASDAVDNAASSVKKGLGL